MLKLMEFALLGVSLLVILGLVIAGPKSSPPPSDENTIGANPLPPSNSGSGQNLIS
jgi:hypothetical protein